ncbi:hypothetical protein QQ045_011165 [Rhodiola kirilowii]
MLGYCSLGLIHKEVAPESIVTAVDCQNQVRSWRLLRSLIEFLIPTCNCAFVEEHEELESKRYTSKNNLIEVTGTIYRYLGGKIYFCIQTDHNSAPSLLLELLVPNKTLAREMQGGVLHIDLKDVTMRRRNGAMIWTMYCNGKKVGLAVKRRANVEDFEMMRLMESVEIGAGTVGNGRRELMYLRARFERCCGLFDVESFHLIDPEGCIGQELSITFHG